LRYTPPPTNTPLATVTPYYEISPTATIGLSTPTVQPTPSDSNISEGGSSKAASPGLWAGIILLVAIVAGILGTWMTTTRIPR